MDSVLVSTTRRPFVGARGDRERVDRSENEREVLIGNCEMVLVSVQAVGRRTMTRRWGGRRGDDDSEVTSARWVD